MTDEGKRQIAYMELCQLRQRCSEYQGRDLLKLEELFWRATGQGGIDYSRVRVQTSPSNTMENSIIEMVELERRLADQDARLRIDISAVAFSPVLTLRYVYGYSWRQVAHSLHKSTDYVRGYLHKKHLVEYFNRNHNIL